MESSQTEVWRFAGSYGKFANGGLEVRRELKVEVKSEKWGENQKRNAQ